jgi:hypothetical protein
MADVCLYDVTSLNACCVDVLRVAKNEYRLGSLFLLLLTGNGSPGGD